MRLRADRVQLEPLDPLEQILASGSIITYRRPGDDPIIDGITRERWLAFGCEVMEHWHARDRIAYPMNPPPWCWTIWGDPDGWTSEPSDRWRAIEAALASAERAIAARNPNLGLWVQELQEALAEMQSNSE